VTIVQLTAQERLDARWHAYQRFNAGDVRPPEGGQHPLIGEIQGVYAEFAVAKYFGVTPDTEIYPFRDGPEADVTADGVTIGVKGTPYWKQPHLIVRPYDTNNDRYVLVSVDTVTGRCGLRGWITGNRLASYPPRPFLEGSRPSRIVPETDLTSIEAW
jgi:hypothetical protein